MHPPQLTKTNENDGGRVTAGQCRPESIYLHTSAGPVEARFLASSILDTFKPPLWQTLVNGLLMDTQRQVLFLLAAAAFPTKSQKPAYPSDEKMPLFSEELLQFGAWLWYIFPLALDHFRTATNHFHQIFARFCLGCNLKTLIVTTL